MLLIAFATEFPVLHKGNRQDPAVPMWGDALINAFLELSEGNHCGEEVPLRRFPNGSRVPLAGRVRC